MEHLQDLLRSEAAQPAQQQEMVLLLEAMPAAWAAHKNGTRPQPTHLASADPAERRIFCPAPDGHLTHTHTASSTATLPALEQPLQPMLGQDLSTDLRPVLVIQWDLTRPWHPRHFLLLFWWKKAYMPNFATTEECRVHSTSYDKGSCFAMAWCTIR